jgi:hypothetical protein
MTNRDLHEEVDIATRNYDLVYKSWKAGGCTREHLRQAEDEMKRAIDAYTEVHTLPELDSRNLNHTPARHMFATGQTKNDSSSG